jgi:hypothetical protein|uniref:Uncharacterized protein n=1 Tax=candidate division WOR-3 bacterium TaxID=2052148 RepID=A0A7C3UZA2_UNCW3
MPSLWEKVKSWLENTTEQALKEAEDLSKKGRMKMQIFSLHRSLKDHFTDLGGLVYQLITTQEKVEENPKVKEIIGKIRELEVELREKERAYEALKKKG